MIRDEELHGLLREMRGALPGVQLLFAALLLAPFSDRFAAVDHVGLWLYGGALLATVLAALLLLAPSLHQHVNFGQRVLQRSVVLRSVRRLTLAGSACLAIGVVASVTLVAEFLFGRMGGIVAASGATTLASLLWYVLPLAHRGGTRAPAIETTSYSRSNPIEVRSPRHEISTPRRGSVN